MELIKILILGIIVSIIALFLKQIKPEYSLLCLIVGSVIILIYILRYVSEILGFFQEVIERTGISQKLFVTMLKIIGLGYLVEFSSGVCRDCGNNSIADKVVLAGKLMIFMVSLPIISSLFNMILDLI
jgi:stage III sporulation protein AD